MGTASKDEAGVFLLKDLDITKLALLFGKTPAVSASEQAIFKSLDYVDKQTREELRAAQKTRAKRYGIQILEDGNLTMPADAKAAGATTDADYADPTNYKYPTFAGHDRLNEDQMGKLRNAPARFAQFGNVYNATSRRKIEARIQAALKKFKIGAFREERKSMDEFDLDTLLRNEENSTVKSLVQGSEHMSDESKDETKEKKQVEKSDDNKPNEDVSPVTISKAEFEALSMRIEKAEQRAEKAENEAAVERDKRVFREYIEKAQEDFPNIGEATEVAHILKWANSTDEDMEKRLVSLLKALDTRIDKSALFGELGTNGAGSTSADPFEEMLEARFQELRKSSDEDADVLRYQAGVQIRKEHPNLARRYFEHV